MSESETIFSSSVAYAGVFNFKEFYQFCYDWLSQERGLSISEKKYDEKITADSKEIAVKWTASKKVTDYFKFDILIEFKITNLKNVEVVQEGIKVKTNQGKVGVTTKGVLVRDYDGKFERDAYRKFLRGIYEKYVIAARIEEYEDKLINACDTFLSQAKAWLDLEGRK